MNDDQRQFLSLLRQPLARLTVEQTAWALNFQHYEIGTLVTLRHLKPIGNPAPNAPKHFHAKDILELAGNKTWLSSLASRQSTATHEEGPIPCWPPPVCCLAGWGCFLRVPGKIVPARRHFPQAHCHWS